MKHRLVIQALAVVAMGLAAQLTAPSADASSLRSAAAECDLCADGCPFNLPAVCAKSCDPGELYGCRTDRNVCTANDGRQYVYAVGCAPPHRF